MPGASIRRRAAVALLLMALSTPAQAASRPNRLVFEGGDGLVYVADVGHQDVRPVRGFSTVDEGWGPTWSPDAREVVYVGEDHPDPTGATWSGQLRSVDVRARRTRVVVSAPGVFLEYPSWSPDGRRIAFGMVTPGPFGQATVSRVMLVDRDGGNLTTFALGRAPALSPDGTRIAYSDWATGSLVVARLSDGTTTQLSPDGVYPGPIGAVKNYAVQPTPPSWSRDGRWLAFSGVRSATRAVVDDAPEDWHAWVVRADGTDAHQLRDAGRVPVAPSWSPDGKRVVLEDQAGILLASVDGRMARRIARTTWVFGSFDGEVAEMPSWSPHGSLISYVHVDVEGPTFELRVMRPDGRDARAGIRLPDDGLGLPSWAPDSPA